ncbi:IgGFc-binding protein-like [Littorina saxatilis]
MKDKNMTSSLHFMTQGTDNVTVNVRSLSTSSKPIDESVQVSPGIVTVFRIPYQLESPMGNVITNDAVKVIATSPIFVEAILQSPSNDDFHPLIPDEFLGKRYFAATFRKSLPITTSFLLVVARDLDTDVTVDLGQLSDAETIEMNGVTYDETDVLRVTLHEMQTLQIQTASDLTGSKITSTKPVAVYSGQNRTHILSPGSGGCVSHISDQLPPVENLGRKFVLVASPDQDGGDFYRFVASEALTTVLIESDPRITARLLLPGDFYEYDLESVEYVFVESDKPVMIVQITKSASVPRLRNTTGDPSMAVLAPLEQGENFYVFSHSLAIEDVYFTFVVESSANDGIRLNNLTLSEYGIVWRAVPGADLVAGYVMLHDVTPQMMKLHHEAGHVFNVHVNLKRNCEARSMPLTYGKPMTVDSASLNSSGTARDAICQITTQLKGDNVDNDCDGHVDEESCSPDDDMTDDDGDGFIDEDCAADTFRWNVYRPRDASKKLAEVVQTVSVKSHGRCVFTCVQQEHCWGVNFLPSTTLTSDPNCELLSGSGLGLVDDSNWRFYEARNRI